MNAVTRGCRALVLLAGTLLTAPPLCAQPAQPEKVSNPYRTLFGGDDARMPSLHAWDLTVSLDSGLDNGMYGLNAGPVDGNAPVSSGVQGIYAASAELAYARRGRRVGSDLRGLASLPYYSLFPDQPLTLAYGGSGSVRLVSGRTSAGVSGNFLHSPYYAAALDPVSGPGSGNGYFGRMSALNPNNDGAAAATLTYKLGRRTSTILGYSYGGTYFTEEIRWNRTQAVTASLERRLSPSMTATGGYLYRSADYRTGDMLTWGSSQDVRAGFTYSRRGPKGKASSFTASIGYSLVDDFGRQYAGWPWSVRFDHAAGTRWSLAANYSRALEYYSTIQRPVWSYRVTVSATGYVSARVQLTFEGNYWNGQRALSIDQGYDTYWASARIQLAVVQWAAVTGAYSYYRYDYPPGYVLPAGMPHQLDRQRVQVGARFWLPLARAGRSGAAHAPASQ